ncbi:MAG: hypothetical protein NTV69_11605, partial [Caldilinea sp.]|nr:hypothetical protein [Caldilinea sp.]
MFAGKVPLVEEWLFVRRGAPTSRNSSTSPNSCTTTVSTDTPTATVLSDLPKHRIKRQSGPNSCFIDHCLSVTTRAYTISTGIDFRGTHGISQIDCGVQIPIQGVSTRLTDENPVRKGHTFV